MLAYPSRVGTDTPFSRTVVPHPVRRSSSSLDFAAPPSTFSCCHVGPRGLPVPDSLFVLADETLERVLHGLGVTFGAPSPALDQSPDPPLLGFARVCSLPPVISPVRPLPVGVATSLRCAGSTRCASCSALVDSHHLDGLLRSGVPSMLQPGPERVRCVSRHQPSFRLLRGPEDPRSNRSSSRHRSPHARFVPFEAFPSSAAVPHHCGRCPPAVVVLQNRWSVPKCQPQNWFVTPTHAGDHRRNDAR
jgi:hypothetical protein